jgi:hypothetical protein
VHVVGWDFQIFSWDYFMNIGNYLIYLLCTFFTKVDLKWSTLLTSRVMKDRIWAKWKPLWFSDIGVHWGLFTLSVVVGRQYKIKSSEIMPTSSNYEIEEVDKTVSILKDRFFWRCLWCTWQSNVFHCQKLNCWFRVTGNGIVSSTQWWTHFQFWRQPTPVDGQLEVCSGPGQSLCWFHAWNGPTS